MAAIHPTAVVSGDARIAPGAVIGPYCVIGPHVEIEADCVLQSHVCVEGRTRLGPGVDIFPFASIGSRTQDMKYRGGTASVVIGGGTVVREYVTVNAATEEDGVTRVGQRCLLMAACHVAHDCTLGDEVILANGALLGGHVEIGSQAVIGGLSGVHQFVRIGRLAIIGGCSKVTQDVPPFMLADGHPLAVHGPNRVGLQRRGVGEDAMRRIKTAYRVLYRSGRATRDALEALPGACGPGDETEELIDFIKESQRGITR